MKQLVQSTVKRFGYTISRIRRRADLPCLNVLELVVQEYVRTHPDMFILQIGANDGQRADPVHAYIEKYRWKGILVEPQPRAFESLRQTYAGHPQLILENCAIAPHDGETKFYTVVDNVPFRWTGLAQLNRERLLRALRAQGFRDAESMIKTITVPAMSVRSVLAKHSVSRVDFLQIDTEGFEFEILKMIDLSVTSPAIIHFEHACVPLDQQVECWEYVASYGYLLAFVLGDTIAYRTKP